MDIWQLVAINGTALVAVIAALWKIVLNHYKEKNERLQKYEAERIASLDYERTVNDKITELSVEVGALKASREGHLNGVNQVVQAVTERLDQSLKEKQNDP